MAFSIDASADEFSLAGTYKLISSTRKNLDTGEIVDTFGKHPSGYINYGADGRMLVLIVSDENDRPTLGGAPPTAEQSANLFRTMVSYGGTYEFDGHTVKHHIDISWNGRGQAPRKFGMFRERATNSSTSPARRLPRPMAR